MAYLTPQVTVGGNGGSSFSFISESTRATLKEISVWAGGWQVKAIKIQLSNGQSRQFGRPGGKLHKFSFNDGEQILALSLWSNDSNNRLGAIKIKTTCLREFFASMTDQELKREYPVDVGSGICLGITGRACADIDNLGFVFLRRIKSTVLTNVNYPTLQQVIPQVATEVITSVPYTNDSDITQSYKVETSTIIKKKSSWSVSEKLDATCNIVVEAGIPEVAEVSTGFSFTVGVTSMYKLVNSEEKRKTFTLPVQVPPRKNVVVDVTIGSATVDLPYLGTLKVTCDNESVLSFSTSGTYKGITYTNAKTTVTEN